MIDQFPAELGFVCAGGCGDTGASPLHRELSGEAGRKHNQHLDLASLLRVTYTALREIYYKPALEEHKRS